MMTCPACGYEGDEWLHDAVKRSGGWDGYICPRCNHHLMVKDGVVQQPDDSEKGSSDGQQQQRSGGDGG